MSQPGNERGRKAGETNRILESPQRLRLAAMRMPIFTTRSRSKADGDAAVRDSAWRHRFNPNSLYWIGVSVQSANDNSVIEWGATANISGRVSPATTPPGR